MIKIVIYRDEYRDIKRYTVSGHADYDEYGKDIVCAAISVLAQTALISLVEVCGVREKEIDFSIDDETGFLDVRLPNKIEASVLMKTQVVLDTLVVGVRSVIESYPKHVTLEYREV